VSVINARATSTEWSENKVHAEFPTP